MKRVVRKKITVYFTVQMQLQCTVNCPNKFVHIFMDIIIYIMPIPRKKNESLIYISIYRA